MRAQRLVLQTGSSKAVGDRAKLDSWHAPEVECVSKGHGRNPYECGVKIGLAMTLKGDLIVSVRSFAATSVSPTRGHHTTTSGSIQMFISQKGYDRNA